MKYLSLVFRDTERCFRYNGFYREANHFVFVGDSRMRQIFLTFQNFMKNGDFDKDKKKKEEEEEEERETETTSSNVDGIVRGPSKNTC